MSTRATRQWESNLDGIQNLRLVEREIGSPAEDEVLVKLNAVSLNYKDWETIEGLFKHHQANQAPPDLVPCSNAAGEIVETGKSVKRWKRLDRVLTICYPTFRSGQIRSEHLALGIGASKDGTNGPADRSFDQKEEDELIPTPSCLSDIEACNFSIAGTTAWMAINGMRPLGEPGGAGETILLQGTGGVSLMGLLIGKASGAKVIVTSSSEEKLQRAKACGADVLINYVVHPDWDQEVLEATDGEGVDIIFENGGAMTVTKSFNCIRWGGLINSIGYVTGKIDPPAERMNINVWALKRNFTLKGLLNGPRDRFEEMLSFCEKHQIRPVVDRVFDFGQTKEALDYLRAGIHFGKVVIQVNS